jgi:hypothetical protein
MERNRKNKYKEEEIPENNNPVDDMINKGLLWKPTRYKFRNK